MSKSLKSTSGFTIIEVLLSTVIMASMLLLIGMAFRSSAEGNSIVMNKAELNEDVRSAGQMISDYARNAIYVYPPGVTLTLQTSAGAGNYGVINPRTLNNTWKIGTDNIVAFILPPLRGFNSVYQTGVNAICNPLVAAPVPLDLNPSFWQVDDSSCLTFVAYYVLSRASVVTATSVPIITTDNPGPDTLNSTTGMIYEYRLQIPLDRLKGTITPGGSVEGYPPIIIGNGTGAGANYNSSPALVADYIEADAINFKFDLSSFTCFGNKTNNARYINSAGVALPVTTTTTAGVTTTAYNTSTAAFTPGCPSNLVAATQFAAGVNLDSFASIAQATLTISAGRKNNLGQNFTTGDMTFPIAPVNLLILGS